MQSQLNGNPPNIDRIREVFPLTGTEIFAWGSIIYNPSGSYIPPWLEAHEAVHCKQQGNDIEGWWDRYLIDAEWRLSQEMEAHQAEYKEFCRLNKDRNLRTRYLTALASRLSSKMYGGIITQQEALNGIKNSTRKS